jgi:mRNA interferase MazF
MRRSNLALLCPIASKTKGWKFEVLLTDTKTKGVILADQIKSLDWQVRKIDFIKKASLGIIDEVFGKIEALLT